MPNAEYVTRQILGNVPPGWTSLFYVAALAAWAVAVILFGRRFLRQRRGRPPELGERRQSLGAGMGGIVSYLAFHRQLLRDTYAGIAHLLTFYGFLVLFIGTCLVFLEHDTPLHFFYGWFYQIASLIIDLGGVAFILGLAMFLGRRLRHGHGRILRAWWVTTLSVLLLVAAVSGFLLEGSRIAVDLPAHERWSSVGYSVALVLREFGMEGERALVLHRLLWAGHAAVCVAFFVLLPWKFFSHLVFSPISWATRTIEPRGRLRLTDLPQQAPGAVVWADLSRRDLLQVDACTTCGRCNTVCPATAAGKPLRPREVVLDIRRAMDGSPGRKSDDADSPSNLAELIADETIWSCTTCGACNHACPVGIDVYGKIVELRRGRVETGIVPEAAEQLFESTAAHFNPFRRPNRDRLQWAQGLDVSVAEPGEAIELLYWVGCAGSFDDDGQRVARAMIKILNGLGICFRVLGTRERCTGDPARRLGEEGLFQQLAAENLALFKEHSVQRVLTHCPHCFNTFRNEYSELGGQYVVEHHSQFLERMIAEKRLRLGGPKQGAITFHDPCYLSRGNDETQAPRSVLAALVGEGLREMPRHGSNSFCCGAGGGSLWLDVQGQERVENLRAVEAVSTGAAVVATACPFCKTMLRTGTLALGLPSDTPDVKDIAELVVEAQGW